MKTALAVLLLVMIGVAGSASYYLYFPSAGVGCVPVRPGSPLRSQVSGTTFGPVTEWKLPGLGRWPNAIAAAPDGSVWFAETEIPGVAHLFPGNGTLVEYAWAGYPTPKPPECLYAASSSGIALWNGRVWAADEFSNGILGVRPSDGSVVRVNTTNNAQYPYWLAVGPDGNLWFTSDNTPAVLGRVYPNLTLSIVGLRVLGQESPIQVSFVNSSLAFVSAVNLGENITTKACACTGHIYSFDPSNVTADIQTKVVGSGFRIATPTSVSYSDGKIWVAQHGPSSVISYDFASGTWTNYPTSRVPWSTTLPLVVEASGGLVWFNEHYANKIAVLNGTRGTLTEISESNPPATGPDGIQNDESFALTAGGVWFTSETGNYVGFVSADYDPGFHVSAADGNGSITLMPGGSASVSLEVAGTWTSPLGVNESDSENFYSAPTSIHLAPSVNAVPTGSSPYLLTIGISLDHSIAPGNYTLAVTLTEGGVQQTVYLFVEVK